MHKRPISIVLTLILLLAACSQGQDSEPSDIEVAGAPFVVVVNKPLHYFTSRLLGDQIAVRLLAPAGQDPALWQPGVENIAVLQQAELVILNGAGYSSWPDKITLSARKLVDASANLQNQLIELEQQTTHSHGPEGEHAHGDYAFTVWMDISLAMGQSEEIARALQQAFPQYDSIIAAKLEALLADLAVLDDQYQQWAWSATQRRIIFSHPVYQYFDRRYRLEGVSLHWEPDQMPTQVQWQNLAALTEGDKNVLLIWEGLPSDAIIEQMKQLNIDYAVVDPGAGPDDLDWLALQQRNLESLVAAADKQASSDKQ